MPTIRTARRAYIAIATAAVAIVILSEVDALPTGWLDPTPGGQYALHLGVIAAAIGCTWLSLRLFAMKRVKRLIKADIAGHQAALWNIRRTALQGAALLFSILAYYATMHTTPLYCAFIAATGMVFCWPKHDEA